MLRRGAFRVMGAMVIALASMSCDADMSKAPSPVARCPQAQPSTPGESPTLAGRARNGLIAYSHAGDIHVGSPASGETVAIVTNPQYEVNPVFSPDGGRIAFIRGDPQDGDSTIVVVRVDGTDERTLLPKGRQHRGFGGIAWTPDGASLVAQLDHPPFTTPYTDGELSLFDASGSGREQVLAPPLPLSIGGHYFVMDNRAAPMFRPPQGDRILAGGRDEVKVFDSDLTTETSVAPSALEAYEPYNTGELKWSPDGSRILFGLGIYPRGGSGLFVMSEDGSGVRRVATDYDEKGLTGLWSPDSSRIAIERRRPDVDQAVLAVVDLDSGDACELESTAASGKDAGAKSSTLSYNNVEHHWYHEGWMWSPDGRSLLVLDEPGAHLKVIDIVTDTATELPWRADSMPSWQQLW